MDAAQVNAPVKSDCHEAVRQASHEAMLLIDPRGELIVEANDGASRLLGYSHEELEGLRLDQVHPDEMARLRSMWTDIQVGSVVRARELTCKTRARQDIQADVAFSGVDVEGDQYVLAAVQEASPSSRLDDVLNSLAMGTAADTGAEFFQSLVRHVATAFDADMALVSEWANPERTHFRAIAHWERGEFRETTEYPVKGTPCEVVLAGKSTCFPQAVSKIFPVSLAEGGFIGVPLKNADGGVLGHLMVGDRNPMIESPLGLPALETFAARAAAELVRLQTEKALRRSEARYRMLYNETPVMLHSSDAEGRLSSVSDLWLSKLGYQRHEVLGRRSTEFLTEESRRHAESVALPAFYRTGVVEGEYLRYRVRDGSTIDVLISAVAERDESGTIIGTQVVSVDVTEQMRLEGAILEIADREQRRLGRDLHDDLGQTLNGVWFMADRMAASSEESNNPLAAPLRKLASSLRTAMTQTRRLVRGLHAADLTGNNLVPALAALARSVEEAYAARQVVCRVDATGPVRLRRPHSATHLYRITQEAVNNALRHGDASEIGIKLKQGQHELVLEVADNGTGLSATAEPSSGFGLHIMRYRARIMGGRLRIESGPGGGTTVTCTIS